MKVRQARKIFKKFMYRNSYDHPWKATTLSKAIAIYYRPYSVGVRIR